SRIDHVPFVQGGQFARRQKSRRHAQSLLTLSMQKFDSIGAAYIMSRSPLIVLMALTSLLVIPGSLPGALQTGSVADLLLRDEVQQAEALLDKQPRTAQSIAFRGEIEFRR